ncbi:acyl-CoA carboxylase subunit epsilon [Amycolatopsis cynarae]|uniref:Acyl-CoA carboxylase subunit epsilon n=1 Tax=Amycolatopsis cynarae TaxID=2995223 RepID=A0ABY7B162_9PSEU|nr:acyl-CoA carboxylase subunit epsilon [Amycolatopsis sp. HUAS 11-8]WAL64957.1 acyl-CoA carboxylase subunit epsilon [Amycolatopsis sp. HUAS 11-8]
MSDENRPFLRIVRGAPDEVELAALTAVVTAAASAQPGQGAPRRRSNWADRARLLRAPLRPGEGAWRASALPR